MEKLINWLITTLAVAVTAYILPGVVVSGFLTALAVALVLGILNIFIKPILVFLTLPINILTLGLFTFVINAFLVWLSSLIVPGFTVDGFLWALVYGAILSFVVWVLDKVL